MPLISSHTCSPRLLTACVALCTVLYASAQGDSLLQQTLGNVNVRGHRVRSHLDTPVQGVTAIGMALMDDMPRILGNADPLHYAQMLPGVQTNSEYDAGLYIAGCDIQHNMVGINGIPIYNAAHMLGFFSVFNATHFSQMQLSKTQAGAASPNRLGGQIDMITADTLARHTSADLSVGPMSSQATLRMPLWSDAAITLSARAAYLNLLYSPWLHIDEMLLRYGFDDLNMTFQWQPDADNQVTADFYWGQDRVRLDDDLYALTSRLTWQNAMAALHWIRRLDCAEWQQSLYMSHYGNDFTLSEDNLNVTLPSRITTAGYRLNYIDSHWHTGVDAAWHSVQPQQPDTKGFFTIKTRPQPRQQAVEASLFADYTATIAPRLQLTAGLRATCFHNDGFTHWSADPSATLTYDAGTAGTLRLSATQRHQYLCRTGFSQSGLPTEFWIAADRDNHPQRCTSIALGYELFLYSKMVRIEAEAYYKQLYNQVEYSGNVYDFLYDEYDLDNILLRGNGHNYGVNLIAEKRKGRLTGWLSYAYGRARRRFDDSRHQGWYPANHERPHEWNAVATYRLDRHWSFGATVVLASGQPYTSPRQFYLMASNIVTEFGQHNANRLKPYCRADVSVSYDFCRKGRRRSGLNLSVYNVLMHNNDLFHRLKIYNNAFANKPFRFALPFMPSLNYYCAL